MILSTRQLQLRGNVRAKIVTLDLEAQKFQHVQFETKISKEMYVLKRIQIVVHFYSAFLLPHSTYLIWKNKYFSNCAIVRYPSKLWPTKFDILEFLVSLFDLLVNINLSPWSLDSCILHGATMVQNQYYVPVTCLTAMFLAKTKQVNHMLGYTKCSHCILFLHYSLTRVH